MPFGVWITHCAARDLRRLLEGGELRLRSDTVLKDAKRRCQTR